MITNSHNEIQPLDCPIEGIIGKEPKNFLEKKNFFSIKKRNKAFHGACQ